MAKDPGKDGKISSLDLQQTVVPRLLTLAVRSTPDPRTDQQLMLSRPRTFVSEEGGGRGDRGMFRGEKKQKKHYEEQRRSYFSRKGMDRKKRMQEKDFFTSIKVPFILNQRVLERFGKPCTQLQSHCEDVRVSLAKPENLEQERGFNKV